MKTYTVRRTLVYEVEAPSEEDALHKVDMISSWDMLDLSERQEWEVAEEEG